jgi:hypothetical protein
VSKTQHKLLTYLCYLVSIAYAGTKFLAVRGLWFHGTEYWQKLWRPFPDWGEGSQLYGALLAAKWNGTRSLMYGILLLAITFFTILYKKYKFLAFLLFEGALIELVNLFWIANGKFRWGWSTAHSNSFMLDSVLWAAALLLCGYYLFMKRDDGVESR